MDTPAPTEDHGRDAEPGTPPAVAGHATPPPKRWHIHRRIYDWVIAWAEHPSALFALFFISMAESIFFPIPPDILLIAMVLGARSRWAAYAAVTSVGSILGGVGGYYLGVMASDTAMEIVKFYNGLGHMEDFKALFSENSFVTIWVAGFTPVPYKVFTITAGLCHEDISIGTLLLASSLSRPLRFFGVALILYYFGPPAKRLIEKYFNLLTLILAAGIVLGFILLPRLTGH